MTKKEKETFSFHSCVQDMIRVSQVTIRITQGNRYPIFTLIDVMLFSAKLDFVDLPSTRVQNILVRARVNV